MNGIKTELIEKIKRMQYPVEQGQQYFEYSSADGFAFLAAAKAMLGLDFLGDLEAMSQRSYKLNAENRIGSVLVSAENWYVYTIWTCLELKWVITKNDVLTHYWQELEQLEQEVLNIGAYDNGLQRYCSEEINLIVPNVTSAAALIFAKSGKLDLMQQRIKTLQDYRNKSGNWFYLEYDKVKDEWTASREEDCYHIAMMIYHLREIDEMFNYKYLCNNIYMESMIWLMNEKPRCGACQKNKLEWFCEGSIGWGVPMMWLAAQRVGLECCDEFDLMWQYLEHPNFRVRAMTAWALSKVIR